MCKAWSHVYVNGGSKCVCCGELKVVVNPEVNTYAMEGCQTIRAEALEGAEGQ